MARLNIEYELEVSHETTTKYKIQNTEKGPKYEESWKNLIKLKCEKPQQKDKKAKKAKKTSSHSTKMYSKYEHTTSKYGNTKRLFKYTSI